MDICRDSHEYVNLCVMQYQAELKKAQMEENTTATAISYRAAQCFKSAAFDIVRFAKTPKELSEMWREFESEIRKLDNMAVGELALEQFELLSVIAGHTWKSKFN